MFVVGFVGFFWIEGCVFVKVCWFLRFVGFKFVDGVKGESRVGG